MNYSRMGIRAQQRQIAASSGKWGMKLWVLIQGAVLLSLIAAILLSMSGGMGVLTGIINTSPEIGMIDVTPSGFSTFVYDTEGNQTAKLVSTDSNRIPVTLDMVPIDLQHAFVAIEDSRFYDHRGIDIQGIIRAGVVGIRNGLHFTEGASTITQQLLKNNVFTSWTTEGETESRIMGLNIASLRRKIQEQYLAVQLEKTMSKDDILINYLNTINLGQNTLGVQAASLRYFNKPVSSLNLSECAVIASITQNPSALNPITHPDKNAKRREKVLNDMCDQGYITKEEKDRALADDVYARIQTTNETAVDDTINSYFVDALVEDVLDDLINAGYNETQAYSLLYSGGLKIYSTQNPKIQKIMDDAFQNEDNFPSNTKWDLDFALTITKANGELENHSAEMLKAYFKGINSSFNMLFSSQDDAYDAVRQYEEAVLEPGDEILKENVRLTPEPQVSMTVLDQYTGQVAAMAGGRGTKDASRTFNRATDAYRQPGSTFKVIAAYAPALDSAGLTLATVYNDAPFCYDNGKPVRNWYSSGYRGICSFRQGIESSLNIIAVKTITAISPQLGFEYCQDFGFTTLTEGIQIGDEIYGDVNQTLALGGLTFGVKNIELTAAYATIANGGEYIKPKLYTRVVDHDGNIILDNSAPNSHRVLKETTAFLLTSALKDVVSGAQGTGGRVNFGTTAIAGKTGTTTANNDVWFAGFTDYYTAATWAGYDNNNAKLTGDEANLAKTLWRAVMSQIHEGLEYRDFARPEGIVEATVCSQSGKLPIPGLCDGCLKTEYFAEGTIPTETCNVHYQGTICRLDGRPATEMCPFKEDGVFTLPLTEPQALARGSALAAGIEPDAVVSTATTTDENGNVISVETHCQHDEAFFEQPNAAEIIAAQQAQLDAAAAAAAQAAAEAAAAAAPPPETPAPAPEEGG
ncbi:MAG: transglycosylase domain-containing protein [Lachnospiraceae bacterium]|nr:transglycosylase domain-containing protein [Lachnospiraceae bacterium]